MFEEKQKLETPEHVFVEFEVAGPASRMMAGFSDGLIIALFGIVVMLVGALTVSFSFSNWLRDPSVAVTVGAMALVVLGYHPFFEWIMKGQTPGKRSMGIRVARVDGRPLDFRTILVRHAMRLVDIQPAGLSLVGIVSMVVSERCMRLGDMVAGTWVLRERAEKSATVASGLPGAYARRREAAAAEAAAAPAAEGRLTREEHDIAGRFLQRAHDLDPDARRRLAREIALPIMRRVGDGGTDFEGFLRTEHRLGAARRLV